MSQKRPPLTLKMSSQGPKPEPVEPPPSTSTPKLKLNFKRDSKTPAPQPPPLSEAPPKPSAKPARKIKPTAKKRAHDENPGSDGDEPPQQVPAQPAIKKLKLNTKAPLSPSSGPFLRVKAKGKPLPRPTGVGYDSEAEDREIDPTLTDNFILRMLPGDDCDYLRKAVAERNFGPVKSGGVDVRMRFLTSDARRAIITIRGRSYAAVLVDLPCVMEAMKSWERKQWWKSGDVCQMLLVLGRCSGDNEALTYQLPTASGELDDKTWQWAHGITPPMRWVRKRRFRKRISVRAVEQEEQDVEALLKADEDCLPGSSKVKQYDSLEDLEREQSQVQPSPDEGYEAYSSEDAEGEEYDDQLNAFEPTQTTIDSAPAEAEEDDDFAAEMERAMAEHAEAENPPHHQPSTTTPGTILEAAAPTSATTPGITPGRIQHEDIAVTTSTDDDEDEEDFESDEDDPSAAGGAALDDEELEQQQEMQRQKEEIADLEAAIHREKEGLARTTNAILRQKVLRKIKSLEGDLEVKRGVGGG